MSTANRRRLEYVSDGAGQRLNVAFTGMRLEQRHRERVSGLEPHEGGFGARNLGRPGETLADVRDRYRQMTEQVDRSIRSLRLGFGCMPLPAAATASGLERLANLLRALEAAESVMEAEVVR